jgi:hypothetical protein
MATAEDAAYFPERFPAKACPALDAGWIPVRVKKTRQNKRLEFRSDSIGTKKALACGLRSTGELRAAGAAGRQA